jgi:hypothetical protein
MKVPAPASGGAYHQPTGGVQKRGRQPSLNYGIFVMGLPNDMNEPRFMVGVACPRSPHCGKLILIAEKLIADKALMCSGDES